MKRSWVWLSKRVAVRVHDTQLERHGGDGGFINESRLEAALARPKNIAGYYERARPEDLAAALAIGIAKGHPFVDGNKRTACVCSLLFLALNGCALRTDDDELADVFVGVAAGTVSEDELAGWFVENAALS